MGDEKQSLGSMQLVTANPTTGRQRSAKGDIRPDDTLSTFADRTGQREGRFGIADERLGKRIIDIDGEKTEFAHFEIIKKKAMLAEFNRVEIAHELAANGITASREEILAMRALSEDEVYILERGTKTFVVSGEGDGKLQLFSAKVFIPFVRNCTEFNGQDVFLNTDNTPVVPELDGAILRIRAVYTKADFPNSTFEPLRGVYYGFELYELNAGEACPSEVAREIFRGMRQMQQAGIENDGMDQFFWLKALQNANRQRRPLLFDGVRVGFSDRFEEMHVKREIDGAETYGNGGYCANAPAMRLENQPFGLAKVPVLAESLAVAEFPVAMNAGVQKTIEVEAPRARKTAAQAEAPVVMRANEFAASGNSFEARQAGRKADDHHKGSSKENSKSYASDEEKNSGSSGKGARKASSKPVPFSSLSGFKAVIFDLDGVIVDSEMVHPRTFERALAKYGVKIDNAHWKRAYTGIGSYAIFDDIVKKYGINEGARELVKKRNAIYLAEIKKNRLPEIAGFAAFNRQLAQNGIKVAVASGGHTNHVEESLRAAGLRGTAFVSIEQVKHGKPAPEIFLKAAKRIGVEPSECIVFEDSLSGVEAASRAGMPCVALSTTMSKKELKGKAALIVNDYRSKELKKLLGVLLAKKKVASAVKRDWAVRKRKGARAGKGMGMPRKIAGRPGAGSRDGKGKGMSRRRAAASRKRK